MTQIERAARAAEFADEAFVAQYPGEAVVARADPNWSKAIARAVLEAIREPDELHVATVKAEGVWNCAQDEIGGIYTEMIDAALKEG